MIEKVTLTILKYYTPDGRRTCSLDKQAGHVCPLLGTVGFRKADVCAPIESKGHRYSGELFRYPIPGGGIGYIAPHPLCLLDSKEE